MEATIARELLFITKLLFAHIQIALEVAPVQYGHITQITHTSKGCKRSYLICRGAPPPHMCALQRLTAVQGRYLGENKNIEWDEFAQAIWT